MVFHVGIDYSGEIEAYNEETKKTLRLKLKMVNENEINKVDDFYIKLNAKLNGKIGCVCIYLSFKYANEIRKELIVKGKEHGFQKIQIVDFYTQLYLNSIFQAKYKPSDSEVIWIFWAEHCSIWQKIKTKAMMVKVLFCVQISNEEDINKIKADSHIEMDPRLIICGSEYKLDVSLIKNIFKTTQIFDIKEFYAVGAALLKARCMSNDLEVLEYDADTHLENIVRVTINDKKFMSIAEGTPLPFQKEMLIHLDEIFLKVEADLHSLAFNERLTVTSKMLLVKECFFTFIIDENRICSTMISENMTEENLENVLWPQYRWVNKLQKAPDNVSTMLFTRTKPSAESLDKPSVKSSVVKNSVKNSVVKPSVKSGAKPRGKRRAKRNLSCYGATPCIADTSRALPPNIPRDDAVKFEFSIIQCWATLCCENEIKVEKNYKEGKLLISYVSFNKEKSRKQVNPCHPVHITSSNQMLNAKLITKNLFEHVKNEIEQLESIDKVVINVPSTFTNLQMVDTHAAAILAKLAEVKVLSVENLLALSVHQLLDQAILILDFKNGALEITVFKIDTKDPFIYKHHNMTLKDIEKQIFEYFTSIFLNNHDVIVKNNTLTSNKLSQKCKEILQWPFLKQEASFNVQEICPELNDLVKFNAMEVLGKIKEIIEQSVSNAEKTLSQIKTILFIGECGEIPILKELLNHMVKNAKHIYGNDRDELIAFGTAYYASYESKKINKYD